MPPIKIKVCATFDEAMNSDKEWLNAMGLELEVIRRVGELAALNPVSKNVPRKKMSWVQDGLSG